MGLMSSGWSILHGMARERPGQVGGVVGLVASCCPAASLHPHCHVALLTVASGQLSPPVSSGWVRHADLGGERKGKRAAVGPGHPYALRGLTSTALSSAVQHFQGPAPWVRAGG